MTCPHFVWPSEDEILFGFMTESYFLFTQTLQNNQISAARSVLVAKGHKCYHPSRIQVLVNLIFYFTLYALLGSSSVFPHVSNKRLQTAQTATRIVVNSFRGFPFHEILVECLLFFRDFLCRQCTIPTSLVVKHGWFQPILQKHESKLKEYSTCWGLRIKHIWNWQKYEP